jgi:hypothetical protein
LFLEPRTSETDRLAEVLPIPASPFTPWDDATLFVYDLDAGTETNYGPGLIPSFSPDETRMAYNLQPSVGANKVRIVDLATGDVLEEFEYTDGLASFIDDNYLYLPGGLAHDLRDGTRTPIDEVDDPVLRAALEGRATGTFPATPGETAYRLERDSWDYENDRCETDPEPGVPEVLCDAERFETWTLTEVATGTLLLRFRAYNASPAGPGEVVIATSPRCEDAAGNVVWCAEVAEELKADDPDGSSPGEEVHGTTNIFVVDIETGAAEFIATASFSATTFYSWSQNWPLSADAGHIVWTGAFCSQESPGNTRVYDRATGQVTELDGSFWVTLTPRGDIGVGPFGPRAILDSDTLEWQIVLPEGTGDVSQSDGGRFLARGGILGHGGLC